ncbi:MAG: hypothetical protein IPF95_06545 [Flavobacteriales bacterium]|nr:hypothetical protein [Flavobacteriales bacterium]MBK6943907.1 hypothetical protein [Flavobacteriales bacterium]MBK7297795.1 hypothetical protein [Flavobacteriales bacterium]MBK9533578.1 hypothetical protein [Flavobacteriales bacterium]MBP9136868.1 hypothetical protein [Flavobacteriales bacterium]
MRTSIIIITVFLSSLIQAQTTGKILVMSNVNAQVMVDSTAVGEVVAGTPFMHNAPVGDHMVHVTYGTGEKAVVQQKEVAVAAEQLSPLNFIFEHKETGTGTAEPVKEPKKIDTE